MRAFGEFRLSGEKIVRASLVFTLLGGVAATGACDKETKGRPSSRHTAARTEAHKDESRCQPLRSFLIDRFRKDGGLRSTNVGECVDVLSTQKHQKIGQIAHRQSFVLLCETAEYLRVEIAGDKVGDVHYSETIKEQFEHKSIPQIAHCSTQSPVTAHK